MSTALPDSQNNRIESTNVAILARLREGGYQMRPCRRAVHLFLLGSVWVMAACTMGDQNSGRLATYFQTPEGSAEWKRSEEQLARAADGAAEEHRRLHTIDSLKAYETAVQAYLDHGFHL